MRNNHNITSLIIMVLFFANVPIIWADGDSSITIAIHNSTDTAKDTPAEMLLIDPQNRRTGFDATAPFNETLRIHEVHEIPDSGYSRQGIADDSGEGKDEPFYRELYVPEPLPGEYKIQIIGKQTGGYSLFSVFYNLNLTKQDYDVSGFIVAGQTVTVNVEFDPSPGAPPLAILKAVTFDVLRNDVIVAQNLSQLGDDKFANSLIKQINLAENIADKCDKRKGHKKDKCKPAVAVLNLFIKRLELANRKCDSRKPQQCDEESDWADFRREHGRDDDYKDFFRDWDRDDWHKWKNKCKRFVTDEALGIIKSDAEVLIKDLGGEIKSGGKDKKEKNEKGD